LPQNIVSGVILRYNLKVMQRLRAGINRFLNFYSNNFLGQIHKNTDIGRWIYNISALSGIKNIVEIGTWNGAGSSKLIAEGVSSNHLKIHSCKVISLEINLTMAATASRRLKRYSFFKVLHGRIIEENDFDKHLLVTYESDWIKQDIMNFRSCPNVLSSIPDKIDLLILDGGEFTTFAEFEILKSRVTQFIIIDDTLTRKSRRVIEDVKASSEFQIVYSSLERNGTAVLCRK